MRRKALSDLLLSSTNQLRTRGSRRLSPVFYSVADFSVINFLTFSTNSEAAISSVFFTARTHIYLAGFSLLYHPPLTGTALSASHVRES